MLKQLLKKCQHFGDFHITEPDIETIRNITIKAVKLAYNATNSSILVENTFSLVAQ